MLPDASLIPFFPEFAHLSFISLRPVFISDMALPWDA